MAQSEIESSYHGHTGVKAASGDVETVPGLILNMTNGQVWFHSYSGGAPIRLKEREGNSGGAL